MATAKEKVDVISDELESIVSFFNQQIKDFQDKHPYISLLPMTEEELQPLENPQDYKPPIILNLGSKKMIIGMAIDLDQL